MSVLNAKGLAVGVAFAVLALAASATPNDANAKQWKGYSQGHHCGG